MSVALSDNKFLAILCLMLFFAGCSSTNKAMLEHVGKPAPIVRLELLNGERVVLDEYRGKTVALIFWATWCSASRPVIEYAGKLARKYAGRGDIAFIAVSLDKLSDYDKLRERIKYRNLDSMIHAFSGNGADDEAAYVLGVKKMPAIFIIDKTGVIRKAGSSKSLLDSVTEY
ncbi:MAG: TlpA family protein disulfide reductase [Candidatus Dadabacteria bacterium]|nr:MAG: TlpA family protein disulfide reductase [Candidatus Dadabacteria bacterium]